MEVTLPAAYDGDDLQVHLIHEVILPEPVEETLASQSMMIQKMTKAAYLV